MANANNQPGTEHFASTLFATTAAELTAEGWAKHEAHGSLSAPLTDEERSLADIKEAEAQESRGTGTRKALNPRGISLPMDADAEEALQKLSKGELSLVQLVCSFCSVLLCHGVTLLRDCGAV